MFATLVAALVLAQPVSTDEMPTNDEAPANVEAPADASPVIEGPAAASPGRSASLLGDDAKQLTEIRDRIDALERRRTHLLVVALIGAAIALPQAAILVGTATVAIILGTLLLLAGPAAALTAFSSVFVLLRILPPWAWVAGGVGALTFGISFGMRTHVGKQLAQERKNLEQEERRLHSGALERPGAREAAVPLTTIASF